jgi:GNAT superfamily N-acetyltransferase
MIMRDLIVRWQRGWGAARQLPDASDVGDGLRVVCHQPGRNIEYVALRADEDPASVARLAERVHAEDLVTWLTVPTHDLQRQLAAVAAAGLVALRTSEQLMTADLAAHPNRAVPAGYRLHAGVNEQQLVVSIVDDSGTVAAGGTVGLCGPDAVADRIFTDPAHRRRGLAAAVMTALAQGAVEHGARNGILIASEEGQQLYAALGWTSVADVLIAAPSGNEYPS